MERNYKRSIKFDVLFLSLTCIMVVVLCIAKEYTNMCIWLVAMILWIVNLVYNLVKFKKYNNT